MPQFEKKTVHVTRMAALVMGGVIGALRPKLAADAALDLDWEKIFGGVTKRTYAERKPGILAALKKGLQGKLAKDASLDDVEKVLDMLEAHEPEAVDADPPEQPTIEGSMSTADPDPHIKASADAEGELPGFLKGKLSEDDYTKAMDLMHARAKDAEPDDEKDKAEDADKDDKDDEKDGAKDADHPPPFQGMPKRGQDSKLTRKAMDAAITAAVKQERDRSLARAREVREAERVVRPWVGEIAIAHDSAEAVYKAALEAIGVKTKDVHPSAYRTILELTPRPGTNLVVTPRLATDGASASSFDTMFPDAKRIRVI